MAHTEAHTPYNVLRVKKGKVIHDHRFGPCDYDPETDNDAYRIRRWTHYRHCKKKKSVIIRCYHTFHKTSNWIDQIHFAKATALNLFDSPVRIGANPHHQEIVSLNGTDPIYSSVFLEIAHKAHDPQDVKPYERYYSRNSSNATETLYEKFNGKIVGEFLLYHDFEVNTTIQEIECSCDNWGPEPHCTREAWGPEFDRYWSSHRDYWNAMTNEKERAHLRDEIVAFKKTYRNGVEDLEIEDDEVDYWTEISKEDDNHFD